MRVMVEAYLANGQKVRKDGNGQLTWSGKRFRSTAWYRNLKWFYTIIPVAYYLIKSEGKTLERIDHELP